MTSKTSRDSAQEIAAFLNEVAIEMTEMPDDPTCPECRGDGWYIGHDDECYDKGDCVCSGVQIQCERCNGLGRLDHSAVAW